MKDIELPPPLGYMNAGHVHELQQGRLHYGYVYPKCGTGAEEAVFTADQLRAAIEADRAQRVPEDAHPMQPVVVAQDKCHRFLENKMVNHLYEWARDRGMGLNEMAVMGFSDEDRMQFAQLIGYSVSGYGELGYVSDKSYEEAARRSAALLASTPAPAQQEPQWWRKRADEIEATVARSGSTEAMRCFTDMRTLLQAATAAQHQEPPQQERGPMTEESDDDKLVDRAIEDLVMQRYGIRKD